MECPILPLLRELFPRSSQPLFRRKRAGRARSPFSSTPPSTTLLQVRVHPASLIKTQHPCLQTQVAHMALPRANFTSLTCPLGLLPRRDAMPSSSVCEAKTLWKAQTADLEWGPNASGLLVAAKTDVDKSGKSYYGSTTLHFVSPRAAIDTALALGTPLFLGPSRFLLLSPLVRNRCSLQGHSIFQSRRTYALTPRVRGHDNR
jgi:hypothetical protein